MILFAEDWKKYPGAIPDYRTKNKSFLELVATYQKMGIKNCLFPLALHDQSLQGVDPFDYDNLTDDQMIRIYNECYTNPWYFVREILKLPASGTEGISIKANRGFIAQWWIRRNNIDCFMMQPRQTGKSVTADGEHVWLNMIRNYKSNSFLLTKDRSLVVKNTARLKEIRKMLPPYLWVPSKKDKDVEDTFNYAHAGNVLVLKSAQTDPVSALNAARGFTNENLHVDEVPFIKYVHVMMPAIASSMDAAIMNAKLNQIPYGILFTTTAGDLSLEEGRYAYGIYSSGCTFTEEMFDLPNREALVDVIHRNTGLPNPRVSMTFDHRMLGYSDEEFWARIRRVDSTDEDINKDYFLIWGKGGRDNIVPSYILDAMGKSAIQPRYSQLNEMGYVMRWYIDKDDIEHYMRTNKLVMGVDTSDQIKRDATAFVLINPVDLTVVATMNIDDANIITTATWLASFMRKYENITLIIEKKSSAQTFIDSILTAFYHAGINPFKRIWNQIIDNRNLKPDVYQILQTNRTPPASTIDACRKYFGFNQTYDTRKLLYSQVLQDATSQSRFVINDTRLVNQISLLRVTAEGKIDHESGKHDDMVIAWLLAHWMLRFGKNLDYYGIDSRRVMLNVGEDGKQLGADDFVDNERIERLSEEADELMSLLMRTHHVGLKDRLEMRLNKVNKELASYGVEPKTMDGIIVNHEMERKKRKRSKLYK